MLVDGGVVVDLMPHSVYKKLGLHDEELIKTNMVLNGFEGKEKTEAKGVMYVELTVEVKLWLPHSLSLRCKVTTTSY